MFLLIYIFILIITRIPLSHHSHSHIDIIWIILNNRCSPPNPARCRRPEEREFLGTKVIIQKTLFLRPYICYTSSHRPINHSLELLSTLVFLCLKRKKYRVFTIFFVSFLVELTDLHKVELENLTEQTDLLKAKLNSLHMDVVNDLLLDERTNLLNC